MTPEIGDWYRQTNGGALFEVVSYDEDDGTVEIQYFDGTVEEIDIEEWDDQVEEKAIEKAEPPENWAGDDEDQFGFDESESAESVQKDR